MKILHIIPAYILSERYGGPIRSVHYLNKWLVKKGVDVTVYTTNVNEGEEVNDVLGQEIVKDGVKVRHFKSTFPRSWYFSRDLNKALKEHIKEFDLVHITSVFLAASVCGAYYAKKYNKPYIISPRGSLMWQPFQKKALKKKLYSVLIESKNLRDAAAIHFTAEAEKKDYEALGFPIRKAITIPNGLDFELSERPGKGAFRTKFKIGNDKKIVLFLSRLDWTKGLDTLIPAFAKVLRHESMQSKQEPVLVIVGGDERGYKKEIEKLVAQHGLAAHVIFTGLLTGVDKISAFQDSNVFVLPSYSESFGMAVVEAMYFGLPTVITSGVAIAKQVAASGAGLVVEKNEQEVSEAIRSILNDEALARDLGQRGAAFVKKEYAAEKVADAFVRAYTEIIKEYHA